MKAMKRIVYKSHSYTEAEWWDIKQQVSLDAEERQKAAKELRIRVFGKTAKDVRESLNQR
jgi:hypothetical protein